MAEFRRVVALIVGMALAAGVAPPPAAADPVVVPPAAYLSLYDDADLRGVERPPDEIYDALVAITGDAALDERIRAAAEARGYTRRPVATADLAPVEGRALQAPAAEAWTAMRAAARADGISLVLTSAHRDLDDQRSLFLLRLGGGTSDAAIERALRTAAPPGYSKHHSGYAIDVGELGSTDAGFARTAAYRWLSDSDFARAKRFGFIPSYPVGGTGMGPDPEAWEFVWVGPGRVACAAGDDPVEGFCDIATESRLDDIAWLAGRGVTVGCAPGRFCPDDAITRGEAASLLWRLHGAPSSTRPAPFVDVFAEDHFRPAVDWLWANGLVTGTSAVTFSPDDFLAPAEAWALSARLIDWAGRPAAEGLSLPPSGAEDDEPDAPVVGDLGGHIDRAEFASVLRATGSA